MNHRHHAYLRIATRVRRQQWARKWTWAEVVGEDNNIVVITSASTR